MKYDIFVSYSRKDFDQVSKLVEEIKALGIRVWFDITGIESGEEFDEKIISAIDESDSLLFIYSENSIASEWTKKEVMYAKNNGMSVMPILLNGEQPSRGWFKFHFGSIDCIDFSNPVQKEKFFNNLKKNYASSINEYNQKKAEDKLKSEIEAKVRAEALKKIRIEAEEEAKAKVNAELKAKVPAHKGGQQRKKTKERKKTEEQKKAEPLKKVEEQKKAEELKKAVELKKAKEERKKAEKEQHEKEREEFRRKIAENLPKCIDVKVTSNGHDELYIHVFTKNVTYGKVIQIARKDGNYERVAKDEVVHNTTSTTFCIDSSSLSSGENKRHTFVVKYKHSSWFIELARIYVVLNYHFHFFSSSELLIKNLSVELK